MYCFHIHISTMRILYWGFRQCPLDNNCKSWITYIILSEERFKGRKDSIFYVCILQKGKCFHAHFQNFRRDRQKQNRNNNNIVSFTRYIIYEANIEFLVEWNLFFAVFTNFHVFTKYSAGFFAGIQFRIAISYYSTIMNEQ